MNDQNSWNERYAAGGYFYGTEANTFLAENAHLLQGPVLSLSEGEGRNAVFMASLGFQVLGVDYSEAGLAKARALAESRGVTIEIEVADLALYQPPERHFGCVVSIFAHLPSSIRKRLYPLIERSLKPNGVVILEAYSENQLPKGTGGPKDIDMLMSVEKLQREFPNLEPLVIREIDREVIEGDGHTGMASVVQFIARNNA
ncbi:MAG: methyltransferase domain-containing protein [Porticoccaceae bacterium]|nr:methyltransferase domain-containing protein [Porticoccaceae bacterium]